MNLLREPERCPQCGEALAQVAGALVCPHCDRRASADPEVLRAAGGETAVVEALLARLAERRRLVRHEGQACLVVGNAILPNGPGVPDALAAMQPLAVPVFDRDGLEREPRVRYPTRREASLVLARAGLDLAALPECHLSVPRSVLWVDANGEAHATPAGLHPCGVLTGEAVEPAPTGAWRRFLDMSLFATDGDRRTYEAWCLSSVFPLEVGLYPLAVVFANAQKAGKTWMVRCLGWALGYASCLPIELDPGKAGQPLRRHVYGSLRSARVLELDNKTGGDSRALSNNDLSELLTEDVVSCDDLYRLGVAFVRNRGLIALTMNDGTVSEDLATRAIGVRLEYDADDPRVAARGDLGELHWREAATSRAVLAEVLWEARRRWNDSRGWTLPGPVTRPESWHRLAWRLTGAPVPPLEAALRELGQVDTVALRAALRTPVAAADLARTLQSHGGAVAVWARRGASALGAKLSELARLPGNAGLRRVRTKAGNLWSWESE